MPRATPFTRADIKARAKSFGGFTTAIPVDLNEQQAAVLLDIVIEERIEEAIRRKADAFTSASFKPIASLIPEDRRSACLEAVNLAFRCYRLNLITYAQEHPARKVEALMRVQRALARSPKDFREELSQLPMGLRQELGIGGLEYFQTMLSIRITYWQGHVRANRPPDKRLAREELTAAIAAIGADFSSGILAKRETKRRQWTANVMRKASVPGLKVLDEKKHKRKFIGFAHPRRRGVE